MNSRQTQKKTVGYCLTVVTSWDVFHWMYLVRSDSTASCRHCLRCSVGLWSVQAIRVNSSHMVLEPSRGNDMEYYLVKSVRVDPWREETYEIKWGPFILNNALQVLLHQHAQWAEHDAGWITWFVVLFFSPAEQKLTCRFNPSALRFRRLCSQ